MKRNEAKLKEKHEYVKHTKLKFDEAEKVMEMTGNGMRKDDIPFVYLAIKTIKGLIDKEYDIKNLPVAFLNKISLLPIDRAVDFVNIMYFKEDLDMKDCYMAIRTFYDFFEEDMDYGSERYNCIHEYITKDPDLLNKTYQTILIIDINLLAKNDDNKFFDYLSKVDYTSLLQFFEENKMHYDPYFNKNLFKLQFSYIKQLLHEKVKSK